MNFLKYENDIFLELENLDLLEEESGVPASIFEFTDDSNFEFTNSELFVY